MCRLLVLLIMFGPVTAVAQSVSDEATNLVLITIDGLRWQEVFRGVSQELVENEDYTERSEQIENSFVKTDPQANAEALMPFLHSTVFQSGSVIGNRDVQSCARVNNPWYFSYPGYNEILTGQVDPNIDSNAAIDNPNNSFLEWLNTNKAAYQGRVAAFGSWDVFPAILNVNRSQLPVNVGLVAAPQNAEEVLLNTLQAEIPSPWPTVRLDAFTHHYGLSYMKREHPKVVYLAYGETDDFAHDGEYDQYVLAANRTDSYIREIWEMIQSDPFYQNQTVLLITTDHGRGEQPLETWQHHASKAAMEGYMTALASYENGIAGSDAVWIAAMGPGIAAQGQIATGATCITSDRIAATLLNVIGQDYKVFNPQAGAPIQLMLDK